MTGRALDELRLVGLGGANKIMAGELSRLVGRAFDRYALPEPKKQGTGSLLYPFEPKLAALAVRYHRTSARVLWDLYSSDATRLEPLYADLLELISADRREWALSGARFSVSAYNVQDFAAGERQIVGVVKNALIDGAKSRGVRLSVDPERPDLNIGVRLYDGKIYVSLDLAGRPMHERGYRQTSTAAPLREDLAALLVMWARYNAKSDVLIDPMAGSGTIVIEAACMAKARPVWQSGRRAACETLAVMKEAMQERAKPLFADTEPLIIANEHDPAAQQALHANLQTSGTAPNVIAQSGDFMNLSPDRVRELVAARGGNPEHGVIVTNPPYGERLRHGPGELKQLYRRLGDWCHGFSGWQAALLVANPDFEASFGGQPRKKKPMRNGPLQGFLYLYDLG
jgi:23S rRNA G2445 N2-methylase RlmL